MCLHSWDHTINHKNEVKMKNRSNRYDINRLKSRHGHKYGKYKECLTMMMLICIKHYLSNIWSSIDEKVKQHWGWVEKSVAHKKILYLTESWIPLCIYWEVNVLFYRERRKKIYCASIFNCITTWKYNAHIDDYGEM